MPINLLSQLKSFSKFRAERKNKKSEKQKTKNAPYNFFNFFEFSSKFWDVATSMLFLDRKEGRMGGWHNPCDQMDKFFC